MLYISHVIVTYVRKDSDITGFYRIQGSAKIIYKVKKRNAPGYNSLHTFVRSEPSEPFNAASPSSGTRARRSLLVREATEELFKKLNEWNFEPQTLAHARESVNEILWPRQMTRRSVA